MNRTSHIFPAAITAILGLSSVCNFAHASNEQSYDVFEKIEQAFSAGEIDDFERVFYKVAAVRAPELLPDGWGTETDVRAPVLKCATPIMVEAFLELKELDGERREKLQWLLMPRQTGDYAYSIQTQEPYALRVQYDSDIYDDTAQAVLDAAITSWELQVDSWGFFEPPIDSDSEYYDFFIEEAGPGVAGYTAPYGQNPATAYNDSFSYIVISPSNTGLQISSVVAHEFNHACQAATDTLEPIGFWENTATYIQSQTFPGAWGDTMSFFRYFQEQPQLPLDYGVQTGAYPYYMYGGSLWLYIMEYLYGNSNPIWIADVWAGCVEETGMNEPDFFDSLGAKLEGDGGFSEMVRAFAQNRYFIGSDGDGQHIPTAESWIGSEVSTERSLTQWDLPVNDEGPSESTAPQPNGCNYIVLSTYEEKEIEFVFWGDADALWNVDVLRVKQGEDTTFSRMTIDEQGAGVLDANAGPDIKFVMVICHLGDEDYDPDSHSWLAADYTYSIRKKFAEPTIEDLIPNVLYRGDQNVFVSVIGDDFVNHEDLTFRISGDGVHITEIQFSESTTITGKATVSQEAALGPRDVVLVLADGTELAAQGAVEIASHNPVDYPDAGQGAVGTGGCDCASAGFHAGSSLLSILFL